MTMNAEPLTPAFSARVREAIGWRWKFGVVPRAKRLFGVADEQWARVVMNRETDRFMRGLPRQSMKLLEISGTADSKWRDFGFASYQATLYPQYDVCAAPLSQAAWDVLVAEQVLEHVERPRAAVRNIHDMLVPGGWFVVTTPFLLRVHAYPGDFSRWTEQGLRQLLVEGGFDDARIVSGAWGNRACVRANFSGFPSWIPWWHSLENEPDFPIVVWAFAQRAPR
jgi:SAM-dependent methyltransferase